jgi:hypothetical protein
MPKFKQLLIIGSTTCVLLAAITYLAASLNRWIEGNQVSGQTYSRAQRAIQFACDIPADGAKYWVDSSGWQTRVIIEYDAPTSPAMFEHDTSKFKQLQSPSWIPSVAAHSGVEVRTAYLWNENTDICQRSVLYAPDEHIVFIECTLPN